MIRRDMMRMVGRRRMVVRMRRRARTSSATGSSNMQK